MAKAIRERAALVNRLASEAWLEAAARDARAARELMEAAVMASILQALERFRADLPFGENGK